MDATEIFLELRSAAGREAAVGTDPGPKPVRLSDSDVINTLVRRHSVHIYADDVVHPDVVTEACALAERIDQALWASGASTGPLRFVLAAARIQDHPPGLYEVDAEGMRFTADFMPGAGLDEMVLQPEFGRAAGVLLVLGSLRTAIEGRGAHGHRLLLSRGGAACEAIWLNVIERGYGASIFAGFLPSVLRELVGVDGWESTQLLAIALGTEGSLVDDGLR